MVAREMQKACKVMLGSGSVLRLFFDRGSNSIRQHDGIVSECGQHQERVFALAEEVQG